MTIRRAEEKDFEAMRAIYNHEVRTGVATFDTEEKGAEDWVQWCLAHNRDNYPLLVAEEDGNVIGYVCLSPYRVRGAYASTAELSLYVDVASRGRGVGKALMRAILDEARADTHTHAVVSVITAGNEVSLRLHRACGFTECGKLREVAFKHGRFLDTVTYEWRK
ncbi:MAG: N-acetyltransferase [Clostridia bacterium]|nr:N-acetyltransferase [Clostridia bacterium]